MVSCRPVLSASDSLNAAVIVTCVRWYLHPHQATASYTLRLASPVPARPEGTRSRSQNCPQDRRFILICVNRAIPENVRNNRRPGFYQKVCTRSLTGGESNCADMSFADLQMSALAGDICGVSENMSVDRYVACVAASCTPRLLGKMRLHLGTMGDCT